MGTFKNKKVWHSNLKYASPLVVTFTTDILPSKYKKGEEIVFFNIRGEPEASHYLVIESETVKKRLEKVVPTLDKWVRVTAENSGDEADLIIESVDDESTPPSETEGKSPARVSFGNASIAENYSVCLKAAYDLVDAVDYATAAQKKDLFANLSSIAASLFIQWDRKNYMVPLTEVEMPAVVSVEVDDGKAKSKEDELPF